MRRATQNTLVVKIKSAKNLKDKDGIFSGKSDPYVRMRLIGNDDLVIASRKTTTITGSLNPVWDQTFHFEGLDTPGAYTLKLNVLDEDWLTKDDPLGETSIELGTLNNQAGFQEFNDVWIDGRVFRAYLSFDLSTAGRWGNAEGSENTLLVRVKTATGLRDADRSSKSDPYVKISVMNSRGGIVAGPKTTSVKEEGGADVEWDEEFFFDRLEHPSAYRLKLAVFDKDRWRDDPLGETIVPLGHLKHTDDFQEFERPLGGDAKIRFALSTGGLWGHGKRAGGGAGPCICC